MGKKTSFEGRQYLSITEAAQFLGVSRPTIYLRLRDGDISSIQVSSRTVRIPVEDLLSLQVEKKVQRMQTLTMHELRKFISREEAVEKYGIKVRKFHEVISKAGLKSVRYGRKAMYPKDRIDELFSKELYPGIKEWYTTEELAAREGISRSRICVIAHELGITVKRGGSVGYIDKVAWDNRKMAPAVIEKEYMTVVDATKHYHIGRARFYDAVNGSNIEKVKKGNFVYFPIKELDKLFKAKEPEIPADIRKNFVKSGEITRMYHIGQDRFLKETREAGVEKVHTDGGFVWYRKDQLDRLFRENVVRYGND